MADVDTDPFSDHDKIDSHPDETGENISLTPGGATWESETEREQKTSFRGKTHESEIFKGERVKNCTNYSV